MIDILREVEIRTDISEALCIPGGLHVTAYLIFTAVRKLQLAEGEYVVVLTSGDGKAAAAHGIASGAVAAPLVFRKLAAAVKVVMPYHPAGAVRGIFSHRNVEEICPCRAKPVGMQHRGIQIVIIAGCEQLAFKIAAAR